MSMAKRGPKKSERTAEEKKRISAAHKKHNAAMRVADAEESEIGRSIGTCPPVVDQDRRDRGEADFQFFCEAYFPETFLLDWSPDHLKVIAKIEQAVLRGGLFAMAMPRGSGKSVISERACLWAILYGHRQYVCLIGSDKESAVSMLDSIKGEIEDNELLAEDFPEACFPIAALEGIANRAKGQLHTGAGGKAERTKIGWREENVIFPTCTFDHPREKSRSAGAIIRVAGITGRLRGMKYKRQDGRTVRPSLVLVDDPQTDESARSEKQCRDLVGVLCGAILGLAGPGCKISGLMPCTVIAKDDMADQILNKDKHPEWQGERTKMIYSFPTNEKLWAEYEQIYRSCLKSKGDISEATEFYRINREPMDVGAEVAWPARHNPDELSAIQHAMNLRIRNEAAFFAEYQNEPLVAESVAGEIVADEISAKTNGMQRGEVPISATRLTMFVDVQQRLLFYAVVAWDDNFTGYIVDYGSYPEQDKASFLMRDATKTIQTTSTATGLEGQIYGALDALTKKMLAHEFKRDDGAMMRIDRCLIDANWGASTDIVYQFCRQSGHATVILPTHGKYVGASSTPFSEYTKRPGDRVGLNWRIPNLHGKRAVRHAVYDTNFWKSFVQSRWGAAMGDAGCLSLFGKKAEEHRMFAQHMTAEYRVQTQGRGRMVDEWKQRPDKPDNHWLDCVVGCAVAASILGCSLEGMGAMEPKKRERVSFKAMQEARRKGRS
jgi:hypothetical protein